MLWLLRHADAAPAHEGQADADRPLTEKGRRQSLVAGAALRRLGISIDVCLTSPKLRALDTARIVCEQLGVEVEIAPELAGGPFDPEALAAGRGEVLLVGHEPDLSDAIHEVTGGRVRMKKSGLAGIEEAELRTLLRPSELKAIAD